MTKKVTTISTQIALFFESPILRPDILFQKINSDMGDIIDSMPQTLPLPAEAPPEIPRVLGTSSFGKHNLNVSLNRLDFMQNYHPTEDIEESIKEFKRNCNNIIISALQSQKIIRIGIVGNHYIPNVNPNKLISELYLNEKSTGSDEISLRINKKSKVGEVIVNNVINLNQGIVAAPNYQGNAVIIQLDYNTEQKEKPLNENTIISLFLEKSNAYSEKHVAEILGL